MVFCFGDEFDILGDEGGDEEEISFDVEDIFFFWIMLFFFVRFLVFNFLVLDLIWEFKFVGVLRVIVKERNMIKFINFN